MGKSSTTSPGRFVAVFCQISQAYMILVQGFGPEENTWEPRENLDCPELIKGFEDKVKMKKEQSKRKGISLESVLKPRSLMSLLSGPRLDEEDGQVPSKKPHPGEDGRPRGWLSSEFSPSSGHLIANISCRV